MGGHEERDRGVRLVDRLQDMEYRGELKVGTRTTFSGPGLIEIRGIEGPGRWGDGYLDVTVRDTYTGGEWVEIVAKTPKGDTP